MAVAPNVAFIRPELSVLLPQYYLIRDCLSGETAIKNAGKKYLPQPNADDTSNENRQRYLAYLLRAVFYNVTRRTLYGLVGQVFMRDPVVTVPAQMQPIVDDANGAGVSLDQQSRKSLAMTLAYSRSGLFVDYPTVAEGASVSDIEAGLIRPVIHTYSPMEIINWRVIERGAREILSLVVLYETYCLEDDGFEMKHSNQFRVLKLDEAGMYVQEIWREVTPSTADGSKLPRNKAPYQIHEVFFPTGPDGNRLTEIPFMFIGSENNDSNADHPNMYDLASLNVSHYRNSADYEESCYMVGQPTPVVVGLTEEWFTNTMGGKITFGSRGGIPLPAGADAKLIQAEPNTMIKEAMEAKERQMVALGAKLVEQQQVQRTAFETKIESTSDGSILASSAKNVNEAYVWALQQCAMFMGLGDSGIEYELNTEFDISKMDPTERSEVIKEWQAGALTFEEMRQILRKAGTATEDDAKAKSAIETDKQAEAQRTIDVALASRPPVGNQSK